MKLFAIGIILCPNQAAMDKIVALNTQLQDRSISLNLANSIPHLTLSMAQVREDDLPTIQAELNTWKIPEMITVTGISNHASSTSKNLLWLDVTTDKQLMILHLKAMELRRGYHVEGVNSSAFHAKKVSPSTMSYVDEFEDHAFDKFAPHITLGYGKMKEEGLPFSFQVVQKLGHLGEHCTITKLL